MNHLIYVYLIYKFLNWYRSHVQDYELVRVWDSLVFEDECEDELQIGISASGSLDEAQTKTVL